MERPEVRGHFYSRYGKRVLDLVLASMGLVVTWPLLCIIALLVRMQLGVPVLYRQWRPGWRERPFVILKFRSMADARDANGVLLPDAQRLTGFGRALRSTSLDELPELWNILRGEMSLVGPRPLLMDYLPLYTPGQARRHEVRPGFTGWAQVNGRNLLTWDQKFDLDIWYVDHVSLRLDLKIIALTIWKTLRREGIHQPGQATTEYFQGTK